MYSLGHLRAAFAASLSYGPLATGGFIMAHKNDERKKEIDADEVIRNYEESPDQAVPSEMNDERANVEWYEQAQQDSRIPPEAVLTGGDVDAAWDQAEVGDETVGGSSPTPDQDIVDEIGRALGVEYGEGEPLRTTEKIERRDEKRWELNPASSEDYVERTQAADASPPAKTEPIPNKRQASSRKRSKRKAA
jgi:Family of unknown function (DUF6335)